MLCHVLRARCRTGGPKGGTTQPHHPDINIHFHTVFHLAGVRFNSVLFRIEQQHVFPDDLVHRLRASDKSGDYSDECVELLGSFGGLFLLDVDFKRYMEHGATGVCDEDMWCRMGRCTLCTCPSRVRMVVNGILCSVGIQCIVRSCVSY